MLETLLNANRIIAVFGAPRLRAALPVLVTPSVAASSFDRHGPPQPAAVPVVTPTRAASAHPAHPLGLLDGRQATTEPPGQAGSPTIDFGGAVSMMRLASGRLILTGIAGAAALIRLGAVWSIRRRPRSRPPEGSR